MFIGHFGVGFAAKYAAPKVSLGMLLFCVLFLDLLWPTLLLLNVEKVEIAPGVSKLTPLKFVSYPISHSLLMVVGWSILIGLIYLLLRKDKKGAIVTGLCVLSHWILDVIVHVPDLQLYPGNSPRLGVGLWNSIPGTLLIELLIFFGGLLFYLRATRPRNRTGSIALWCLVIFILSVYFLNLFGPVPSNSAAIAWGAQLQWLFVPWGYWIDKNRGTATAQMA